MAYTINKTNGEILVTIPDGTANTSTSMKLFGKNYVGYGEFLNENFVYLLESGANSVPPTNPLIGQIWYDTTGAGLSVYDGQFFKNIGAISYDTAQPTTPVIGDFWFDPTQEVLHVHNGSHFLIIGPDSAAINALSIVVDGKVDVTGDTMTGFLTLNADPTAASHAATKDYVDTEVANAGGGTGLPDPDKVDVAGDTMTGFLTLHAAPIANSQAATKLYVDTAIATGGAGPDPAKVDVAGDTMTGALVLPGNPTASLEAATKNYVDTEIANIGSPADKVDVAGDTMTGALTLPGNPTSNLHASTKLYVDTQINNIDTVGAPTFPQGTKIVFAQSSAPIGWSQDVSRNDYMLRLVSGVAGGNGGSNSPISTHTHTVSGHNHTVYGHTHSVNSHTHSVVGHSHSVPSHTHSVGTHIHGTAAMSLSTLQIPAHNHNAYKMQNVVAGGTENKGVQWIVNGNAGTAYNALITSGGNGHSHTHGNTGSNAASNTGGTSVTTGTSTASNTGSTSTATGNAGSGSTSTNSTSTSGSGYSPKYVNIMIAVKD